MKDRLDWWEKLKFYKKEMLGSGSGLWEPKAEYGFKQELYKVETEIGLTILTILKKQG